MAFLMPPPYHSTKQLLLTASSKQQHLNTSLSHNNNNNDEQMANRNFIAPASIVKYTQQCSSESDEFGFDMHSVVSMEILENQDQYKQTLKHFPQQKLTTFVEAKNQEVLRRVAEMQAMVNASEKYLHENVDENGFLKPLNGNVNVNYWRETSVDVESDDNESQTSCNKQFASSNGNAATTDSIKHSDSLTLLAETIKNDLNGINNGLNAIYTPFDDCRSNGSSTNDTASTAPSSISNTPKVQRRINGLSQIISDLQALGNDSSDCDSESLNYTPNCSPMHKANGIGNGDSSCQLRGAGSKPFKQIRTSFGLHSPDALGDAKEGMNLKEYLKQLKEASNKENNVGQDLAAKKLAELYGYEIGEEMIEMDPEMIDLTSIPPPQTPDELDIPNTMLNAPPRGFDDVDSGGGRRAKTTTELEEFLKKVRVEPPTQIVTPAVELTPEEIAQFIIPPPPSTNTTTTSSSMSKTSIIKPLNVKPIPPVKPSLSSPVKPPVLSPKPILSPPPVIRDSHSKNCNSFYDNHHGIMNCCDHSHSSNVMPIPPTLEQGPGTPENNVKNKVLMFNNTHIKYPFELVGGGGGSNTSSIDRRVTFGMTNVMNGGAYTNGNGTAGSSSDDNESLKLPPKRYQMNGHTCNNILQNGINRVPERPPKSAELQLRLNSPVKTFTNHHNFGPYSLYNNTNYDNGMPPSLPPRVNEKSPPPINKPPLPPQKPIFSPMGSPKSPLPLFKNGSTNSSPIRTAGSPHFHHRHYNTMREGSNTMFNFNQPMVTNNNNNGSSNGINPLSSPQTIRYQPNGHCNITTSSTQNGHDKIPLSVLCSPQFARKPACNHHLQVPGSPQLSNRNGHVLNIATLMSKTSMAMSGLLMKLDQVAVLCADAQTAGGGQEIDEGKFQMAKDELTEVTLGLVTASKLLVIAMSDSNAQNLPEHLTACLTALRRITELAQDLVRFTSAPLQTRNIILKIHDVASSFREMVCVPVGAAGAGQLALNANCLANVLATLLRSLRVFSP
jgi:hypothetical protein